MKNDEYTQYYTTMGSRIPTDEQWNYFKIVANDIPLGNNFLKMEIEGGDTYTPQLGEISIFENPDTTIIKITDIILTPDMHKLKCLTS